MTTVTTIDAGRAAGYRSAGYWRDETLDVRFSNAAAKGPDRVGVVDARGSLTYGRLADRVDHLAGSLRDLGVGRGDRVSVQLPNCTEFVVAHLALERLGAVTNLMLTQYRRHDIAPMLDKLDSVAAIFPGLYRGFEHQAMWKELRRNRRSLRHLVVVDDADSRPEAGVHRFSDLVKGHAIARFEAGPRNGDEATMVIFTSGTVASKGVIHSHNTSLYGIESYARELSLDDQSVVWMPSPVSHGTGLQWGVRTAMYLGAKLVLQDKWSPDEAVELIAREGCEVMMGATTFIQDLRRVGVGHRAAFSSLRYLVSAGAPIPPGLVTGIRNELGIEILRAYGQSEHFVSTLCRPDDPEDRRIATDGRPLDGTEVAVFSAGRERQLPPGEEGELAVRGPGVALGYLGDPDRTRDTWRKGGWQFTDDLATVDEQGFVQIRGRQKDIIIRGGLNISPSEIEAVLIEHPSVQQVGVVGVPHERLGEQICAVVVPARGDLELAELTTFLVNRGMSKLKLPEHLVLRGELPRTASGKIRKDILRQDVAAEWPARIPTDGEEVP